MYSLNTNLINYEYNKVDHLLIIDTKKDVVHLNIVMVCYCVVQFYRRKKTKKVLEKQENIMTDLSSTKLKITNIGSILHNSYQNARC